MDMETYRKYREGLLQTRPCGKRSATPGRHNTRTHPEGVTCHDPTFPASLFPTGQPSPVHPRSPAGADRQRLHRPRSATTPPSARLARGTGYTAGVTSGTTMLGPAIQTIWSKEILFQAMPVLRFEQFAVKKTELGVMPGLQVNFMRYNNLPIPAGPLVEGVRMQTYGITAQQYQITVAEHGFAVAVSELLLNASFDDVMASASRLLGRNMALYLDTPGSHDAPAAHQRGLRLRAARPTSPPATACTTPAPPGPAAPSITDARPSTSPCTRSRTPSRRWPPRTSPGSGETYVSFIHPHQSRRLRDTPEFIEVTKYAAPGNFMLGEIGRLYDVVFIETTQIDAAPPATPARVPSTLGAAAVRGDDRVGRRGAYWRGRLHHAGASRPGRRPYQDDGPGAVATPGWGRAWPTGTALPPTASTKA